MCNVHARLFKFLLPLGLPYGSVLFTTWLVRGTVTNSLYASAGFRFFPFAMVGSKLGCTIGFATRKRCVYNRYRHVTGAGSHRSPVCPSSLSTIVVVSIPLVGKNPTRDQVIRKFYSEVFIRQFCSMTSYPRAQAITPKRPVKMASNQSLNHLLNFTLPPRQTQPQGLPRRSRRAVNPAVWNKESECCHLPYLVHVFTAFQGL
jgi:hypothetical protein